MNKTRKQEGIIGKFFMFTYDNQILEFVIKNNHLLYCETISKDQGITKLVINSNLEAHLENGERLLYDKESLSVGHYLIDPSLMEYLAYYQLIEYNMEMAHVYGFCPEYASDIPVYDQALIKNRSKKGWNGQKRIGCL